MSSSAPVPLLPLEIKAQILGYCDRRTLARTSQVSLAFLQFSGPLLYKTITIRGKKQLAKLIRSDTVSTSIAPFVSFGQTISLTSVALDAGCLFSDLVRRVSSTPIFLDKLIVDLRETDRVGVDRADVTLPTFLSSFKPRHLHVLAHPTAAHRISHFCYIPRDLAIAGQLATVTLTGVFPVWQGSTTYTPPPQIKLQELCFDISRRESTKGRLAPVLDEIAWYAGSSAKRSVPRHWPVCMRVRVWLSDQEEVNFAKNRLVGCRCASLEIGVKQPATA